MANDNLLAGGAGFAEGIRDILVPWMQAKMSKKLSSVPIKRVEELSGIKTGLPSEEMITPAEFPLVKQRMISETMTPFYDVNSGETSYMPRGTRTFDSSKKYASANDIRKEFINRPEVKEYMEISTNVKSMDSMLKRALTGDNKNKVAFDQAMISMFNKLTDPSSVVRESEYARTPENLPVVNRFYGAFKKLMEGGAGLTDDDRKAIVFGAKIIGNERGNQYQTTRAGYEDLAKKQGIDVSLITGTIPEFTGFNLGEVQVSENKKTNESKEIKTPIAQKGVTGSSDDILKKYGVIK